MPAIATCDGTIPRFEVITQHLESAMHKAALKAESLKLLSSTEKILTAPLPRYIFKSNAELAKSIGGKMIEIYANAKRGAPAFSWPAHYVANKMAVCFDPSEPHSEWEPSAGELTYVNPNSHQFLLQAIASPEYPNVKHKLENCIAASLRVDGSVDKVQTDNIHVMVKTVDQIGKEETLFIGFVEPIERGVYGYLSAVKSAVEQILPWPVLVKCLSSVVTDGECLNTGQRNSLWKSLDDERVAAGCHKLLKVWCAVHRSNLCWKDATKSVTELGTLISNAKELSKFYHTSALKTKELANISENAAVRFPTHYEIRWAEYVGHLFTAVYKNWPFIIQHFKQLEKEEEAKGLLRKWTDVGNLKLLVVAIDVLFLLERLQKRLQSDSTIIFDLRAEVGVLLNHLDSMEHSPLLGGIEAEFERELTWNATDHCGVYKGCQLWVKERRRKSIHLYVSDVRDANAVRFEIIQSIRNFVQTRLPESEFDSLKPLHHLLPPEDITDMDLEKCHAMVVPDHSLVDFICSYREAAKKFGQEVAIGSSIREIYKKIIHVAEWKPLSCALARILAAKPHSADVERLISSYNLLKTDDRSNMNSDTLRAYLFIRQNMPPLVKWDPRPAISHWLNEKTRRPDQTHLKAKDQTYFKGIFY
jgi:hypothetical protein